jgi:hypothetical protein
MARKAKLEPLAVSLEEGARMMGICGRTLHTRALEDPTLPVIKLGGRRLVVVDRLREWLNERAAERAQ